MERNASFKNVVKKLLKIYQYPPCRIDVISNKTNDPHPLSPTEKNNYYIKIVLILLFSYVFKITLEK